MPNAFSDTVVYNLKKSTPNEIVNSYLNRFDITFYNQKNQKMTKYKLTALLMIISFLKIYGQGENLFNDTYLHEIHFNNMDTTLIDGSKVYQMVNMVFDGNAVDSIGIKEKGNISNDVPNLKVPFKVKTNKYVNGKKYDGIKEFTLHNNFQDPTMMREKLTYEMCGYLGLYALRTSFAKVYINGVYWGLYTIVEGKDEMFKQQFDHRDADAVESLDFGTMCFISNNPEDYYANSSGFPSYQLENGNEETAFQRFADMIDAANNTNDATYLDDVANHLNLEHFFKYQAANVYLMNFDSYIGFNGNQIYMYDTLYNIWQVIPWDFNASLNLWDDGNGTQTADMYPLFPARITSGCIAEKLMTIPTLKNYYLDAICKLANEYAEPSIINDRIDFFKSQIQAAVYSDWRKVYTNQDFDETTEFGDFNIDFNEFEGLKTFFSERSSLMQQSLNDEGYDCMTISTAEYLTASNPKIVVYPNPLSDELNLKTTENIQEVSIFNSNGGLVKKIIAPTFPIRVQELNAGIYFIVLNNGNQIFNSKIVIE